jgi:site-specific DNA-methyltransferase (adenine-specific)
MLEIDKIYQGDCLELMPIIPDKTIDMILCDLPYGITDCKWDNIINIELMWKEYTRIIKDRGAIVLTSSQPFTSMLVMSNLSLFKYEWIWKKTKASNFQLAKYNPMKIHENVLVFYKKTPIFNQQNLVTGNFYNSRKGGKQMTHLAHFNPEYVSKGKNYNKSILEFNSVHKPFHPTQKPVALFEYLIKTYTNENDLVLDNCIGSGTTAIACINTNRHFIGIEKEQKYVDIANKRIKETPIPLEKFIG